MTIRLTTLFITAALTLPAAAWSKPGDRDFGQTFPVASRLCQAVADGHGPKRLHDHEADVTTACGALQSAYDAAVAGAPDTAALKQAVADAKSSVQSACQRQAGGDQTTPDQSTPPAATQSSFDRSGCRAAIEQARQSVRSARASFRDGAKTYHQSIRTARRAFWTTIKGLVGGSSAGVPNAAGTPDLPADTPATA